MSTSGDGRAERRHPHPSGPHPSVPSRLLLVRHGESDWNRDRRIQGQLDPPLSDGGQRQARLLGERLARHRFVAFYASDLCRSMQTAAAVGEALGEDPVPLPALREGALGGWGGKTSAQLAEEYPDRWEAWVPTPRGIWSRRARARSRSRRGC